MIFVTGDTHRQFDRIEVFCLQHGTTTDDTLVILGDAGINYFGGWSDHDVKYRLSKFPITMLCIHGNHEMRPENCPGYTVREYKGGLVMYQSEYPNLLFAIDGEVYDLDGNRCMAIGGAYSVDKDYRISIGANWWPDEQPSAATKRHVESELRDRNNTVDVFLTHTCPYKYIPREMFLPGVDQSMVDNSTEYWLDTIEESSRYSRWYCGHYHTDKAIDKVRFMYKQISIL